MTEEVQREENEHWAELTITNRLGLHARAAARLVELVSQFEAEIDMIKGNEAVDAGSVLSLLALECPMGTKVVVRARGIDSEPALAAVTDLIVGKFGEE